MPLRGRLHELEPSRKEIARPTLRCPVEDIDYGDGSGTVVQTRNNTGQTSECRDPEHARREELDQCLVTSRQRGCPLDTPTSWTAATAPTAIARNYSS